MSEEKPFHLTDAEVKYFHEVWNAAMRRGEPWALCFWLEGKRLLDSCAVIENGRLIYDLNLIPDQRPSARGRTAAVLPLRGTLR